MQRFGYGASPVCPKCGDVEEVVLECPIFKVIRKEMPVISVENVMEQRHEKSTWNAVSGAISKIMSELQHKWRADQQTNIANIA